MLTSPELANKADAIDRLSTLPMLSTSDGGDELEWGLETDGGLTHVIRGEPRMGCADMAAVRDAAAAGLGVALLPDHVCRDALLAGQLVRVLSD